jgi:Flp pilus assembly pilin Flp
MGSCRHRPFGRCGIVRPSREVRPITRVELRRRLDILRAAVAGRIRRLGLAKRGSTMLKASAYLRTQAFRIRENRKDEGATATEYGLLVAFIAFLIIVGVTAFGTALNTFFTNLGAEVGGWAPGG